MSNISRRDFMKTAGVMTLAVAASGVLAGCSTAAEEEVVQTSATSATVGDYTVSIADTKLVTSTTTTTDGTESSTAQMLFVLLGVKANKESASAKSISMKVKTTGLTTATTTYTEKGLKENVFGNKKLNLNELTVTSGGATISATASTDYADGSFYYVAYDVKKNSDGSFATPTFKTVINTGDEYITLTATIPAAINVVPSKLAAS